MAQAIASTGSEHFRQDMLYKIARKHEAEELTLQNPVPSTPTLPGELSPSSSVPDISVIVQCE